jgi:hypothetical protein
MQLIPLYEFVKTHDDIETIRRYAEFLNQDLEIEMFIPIRGQPNQMLFEGFRVVKNRIRQDVLMHQQTPIAVMEVNGEYWFNHKSIESLTYLMPTLTDGAIDYIYVE